MNRPVDYISARAGSGRHIVFTCRTRNMSSVAVDVMSTFVKYFPEEGRYDSLSSVEIALRHFQRESGTSYVRRACRTAEYYQKIYGELIPERFGFKYIYYKCIHHGKDKPEGSRGRR